ncbi:MAG: ATP synthase subunit I [Deltaproteobacteria bacterium]|nr:ATP synthase subunit I [Deltaproteobacteria bacterium]
MKRIEKDPLQTRIEISNWLVLTVLVVLSAMLASGEFTLGVLLGGFISIVNFHWLNRDIFKMFGHLTPGAPPPKPASAVFGFFLRLCVTGIILYLLFTTTPANPIGVAVGLSVVVFNLIITAVWLGLKRNSFKEA